MVNDGLKYHLIPKSCAHMQIEYLPKKISHVKLKKLHKIQYTEKEVTLSFSEASHFAVPFADASSCVYFDDSKACIKIHNAKTLYNIQFAQF